MGSPDVPTPHGRTWDDAEKQRQKDIRAFKLLLKRLGVFRHHIRRCSVCDGYMIVNQPCPLCEEARG